MTGPMLAIFPHPDDETFTAGGLLAAAAERGLPVTLLCATRGEAGESAIPDLEGTDQLGAIRERELRDAMTHLGVSDVRFLGYRDSGMEGSPESAHPRAFVRAPIEDVAKAIATEIRALRPSLIVTFGPEGVYGHPDHLHLHLAVVRAVGLAGDPDVSLPGAASAWQTPALLFGTAPREDMLALFERPNSPLPSLSESARANLGTPRSEISHVLDIRRWEQPKRAAIAAHFTQTGDGGPLSQMPDEAIESRLGHEFFVRAPLPWGRSDTDPDFLDQLIAEQAPG